ncbi:MAG: carbohydrate-binding family 9-like protein [bacterium]
MPTYTMRATATPPALDGAFDAGAWAGAEEGRVTLFNEKGSDHRPDVRFRLLHDHAGIYVKFEVRDRYVRSVQTAYQGSVCTDSCAEFFVQPKAGKGYFNFEVNAGGTLLLFYIEDASRAPGGFAKYQEVSEEWGHKVRIWHSLPAVVEPEITAPVTWGIGYHVPVALFEAYTGPLGRLSGQAWRANFYKCADKTSHPHWGSWAPLTSLNFHLPECFGDLAIE